MPRHSRSETYTDGNGYVHDSRYDPDEFSTYGQGSYGPSSNSLYSTSRPFRFFPSNRAVYDEYGYSMKGAYAGKEDLRHRTSRYQFSESAPASSSDPRRRLDPGTLDREPAYGRPSRLFQQVHLDNRSARHEARQREREQVELECALQHEQDRERRCAEQATYDERDDNPYIRSRSDRGGRCGAVTAANEKYLAYQQAALREEQQARYDSTPSTVHGYGRGWFPAYEFR